MSTTCFHRVYGKAKTEEGVKGENRFIVRYRSKTERCKRSGPAGERAWR